MKTNTSGAADHRGPLRIGEKVQLTDPKGRLHTIVLEPGREFHTHKGYLAHSALIGASEGTVVHTTGGVPYQVMRPLLEDFVMSMPRGAAVVYPKDAALIVTFGDIFPGATVVEAGVGSGALTLSLLRAVGEKGTVHSFERREEFARIAAGNIEDFFGGAHPAWQLTIGDLSEALPEAYGPGEVDRVVLDMLTPWECLPAVTRALAPGGVLTCYVATVPQLSRMAEAIRESAAYTEPRPMEAMVREWHLDGLAVRPDHRMIAHTGFLLFARRLSDDTTPLELHRRPQGSEPSAVDREAWEGGEITNEAIGVREATGKKLRRVAREAGRRSRVEQAAADENHTRTTEEEQ
ncbi:tRNA (adenine-N1)-methyltransferase [Brevibacterium daeguense]|uniref:tRNA (Adenine-N1)-methyltransferase n=1 Tax=Brevibacterium daeguense TaxID=909936 RepID=A0ABP8ENQ5_9MICO|nr:tRNA (adenine-N1)-methyltransferase [Brevibacterium daeguense]